MFKTHTLQVFALVALALLPAGCTRARRQVMLLVTTNVPCPTIDRITIRLSRGAGTPTSYTYNQTFALTGDNCSTTSNSAFGRVPLGDGMEFRLGVVDSRRTDDRLRVEIEALGMINILTIAETDFVDDKVYGLPMELLRDCSTASACPAGFVCRAIPRSTTPGCGSVYRRPGTLGAFVTPAALQVDEWVDLDD